ncbi:hypothetical protein [Acinetobacter sp.]|uniref:hypothetical protein n=1 Tax=Acinetobacter sp. TaxID=472 RepID=UPI00283AAE3A|nr:hypothetical protein [Acinetobacter sp.]
MRINKLLVVICVFVIFFIGYLFLSKNEKVSQDEKNIGLINQNEKNQDVSQVSGKNDNWAGGKNLNSELNKKIALNMTEDKFEKIMKEGLANGVVYTSLNDFDEITSASIKQALKNLNDKGSLSGGVKTNEFSDLEKARENLRDKTLDKMVKDLDGFKSTPNEILEQYSLKLTGAQNFGSYNKGEGWSGIYKLYENNKSKIEIEQIHLKPEKSTQQLVKEALNSSLANDTPAIYEKLPSEMLQKLTFVSDRNYYQINAYNLSENELIAIANSIIKSPEK